MERNIPATCLGCGKTRMIIAHTDDAQSPPDIHEQFGMKYYCSGCDTIERTVRGKAVEVSD